MQVIPNFILYEPLDVDSSVIEAYKALCVGAFFSFFCSAALCVTFMLMLNITGSDKEANHFIGTLKDTTGGLGPHAPLVMLYLGVVCATVFLGLLTWMAYGTDAFIGAVVLAAIAILVTAFFYFEAAAALCVARATQATTEVSTQVTLSVTEVKRLLKELTHLKKGVENIQSEDKFIQYTRLKSKVTSGLTTTCVRIIKEVFDQEVKRQTRECS